MRRTQLYLDDQLWGALHARARTEKTTVSELVRQAVRERYLGDREQRRAAPWSVSLEAGEERAMTPAPNCEGFAAETGSTS